MNKPNIVFVFADQWRAQACGYAGNPQVQTPHIDAFAAESINFTNAVSGCPVCTPYRASLMTGQYPLTTGLFLNDVPVQPNKHCIADEFKRAGYDTAYIGKWHINGHGRSNYITPERRLGFDYWKVLECTHNYNNSPYYAQDSDQQLIWDGYDAEAQTADAQEYIKNRTNDNPFLLMLSWGPPHNPYETAPEKFQALYNPDDIELRANVPDECADKARQDLAGYYAHCSALDQYLGDLLATLEKQGLSENTMVVFTSDHGDMIGSQGMQRKQKPWNESIQVPFLLRWPGMDNWQPAACSGPIDAPDIMPTLLGLCGLAIPDTAEGFDYSNHIQGQVDPSGGAALLQLPHPFGEWERRNGGCEYRGVYTGEFMYARNLNGPWLLYDNTKDPFQQNNLINDPAYTEIQKSLEIVLQQKLDANKDQFLHGDEYIKQWGYTTDANGTVRYKN